MRHTLTQEAIARLNQQRHTMREYYKVLCDLYDRTTESSDTCEDYHECLALERTLGELNRTMGLYETVIERMGHAEEMFTLIKIGEG